jgi:hypothetical protein
LKLIRIGLLENVTTFWVSQTKKTIVSQNQSIKEKMRPGFTNKNDNNQVCIKLYTSIAD